MGQCISILVCRLNLKAEKPLGFLRNIFLLLTVHLGSGWSSVIWNRWAQMLLDASVVILGGGCQFRLFPPPQNIFLYPQNDHDTKDNQQFSFWPTGYAWIGNIWLLRRLICSVPQLQSELKLLCNWSSTLIPYSSVLVLRKAREWHGLIFYFHNRLTDGFGHLNYLSVIHLQHEWV